VKHNAVTNGFATPRAVVADATREVSLMDEFGFGGAHQHHSYAPDPNAGLGGDPVLFAEIWPDEGLDLVLGIFPQGGANITNTFLALFTTFTASTVGSSSNPADSYTEPSGGAYARQTINSASWGAIAAGTGGRKTTASQVTFPTATAVWGTVNGFWLANILSSTADKTLFAANFDDTTAVTINTNDIIKVTPTIQYNN